MHVVRRLLAIAEVFFGYLPCVFSVSEDGITLEDLGREGRRPIMIAYVGSGVQMRIPMVRSGGFGRRNSIWQR